MYASIQKFLYELFMELWAFWVELFVVSASFQKKQRVKGSNILLLCLLLKTIKKFGPYISLSFVLIWTNWKDKILLVFYIFLERNESKNICLFTIKFYAENLICSEKFFFLKLLYHLWSKKSLEVHIPLFLQIDRWCMINNYYVL